MICELNGRVLYSFLNAICKKIFYFDVDITDEVIKDNFFADLDLNEALGIIDYFQTLFSKFAENKWDSVKMEDKLKNTEDLSSDQKDVVTRFWNAESSKVCNVLFFSLFRRFISFFSDVDS